MGCASPQNAGSPNVPAHHLNRVHYILNKVITSSSNQSSFECK